MRFNFAASSELVTQINEGAPVDVFASADVSNMAKLTDAGNNALAAPRIEPGTSATQRQRATRLRHAPRCRV